MSMLRNHYHSGSMHFNLDIVLYFVSAIERQWLSVLLQTKTYHALYVHAEWQRSICLSNS